MSVVFEVDAELSVELEAFDVPSVLQPANKIAVNAIANNDNFFILKMLIINQSSLWQKQIGCFR